MTLWTPKIVLIYHKAMLKSIYFFSCDIVLKVSLKIILFAVDVKQITPTVDDFLLLVSQQDLTQLEGLYENETAVTFCNSDEVEIFLHLSEFVDWLICTLNT